MTIAIRNVSKSFARFPALNGVSLDIRDGELIALLGPSGSGKTTLLRTIAGLEFPDEGAVFFDDADVTYASAAERRVGFVFQQYALFKHMTVARNIGYGLEARPRAQRPSAAEIDAKVEELLKLVDLPGLGKRYANQLSGGQRQRVALARALAVSPRVLLLDEPFGALDATVRKSLRKELRRIHERTGVTTIFVTHDQEEALELADRVAILNHGRIEQVGAPKEVVDAPLSAFVSGFVGEANCFEGEVRDRLFRSGDVVAPAEVAVAGRARLYVRPHHFSLAEADEPGFEARVGRVVEQGPVSRIEGVTRCGQTIDAAFAHDVAARLTHGANVRLAVTRAHVFAA